MVAAREAGRTLGSVTGCGARAKCFLNEQAVAVFNSSSRKCVFCSLVFFSSANRAAWPEPPGLSTAGRFGPGPPRMWRRRLERESGGGGRGQRANEPPCRPGQGRCPQGRLWRQGPWGGVTVCCVPLARSKRLWERGRRALPGVNGAAGGLTQAGAAATGGGTWPPTRDGAASAAHGETPRRPRRPARCSVQGHGVCFRVTSADSSVGRSGAKAPCTGDSVPL